MAGGKTSEAAANTDVPNSSAARTPSKSPRSKSADKDDIIQSSQNSEGDFTSSQAIEMSERCSKQLHMPTEILHKTQELRYILEADLLACDAKWTLFVAAAFSYRYDCKLRPCPPMFAHEVAGYQIDALASVIKDTPKLNVVLQYIIEQNYKEIGTEVIELLHWVLVTLRQPYLRLVPGNEVDILLQAIDEKSTIRKPTHVFEVDDAEGYHSTDEFRKKVAEFPLQLAFCGQTLDTYFSLIQNGFPTSETEPLKLSTDLFSILKNTPSGAAWGASQCGSLIACVAVCEFAYDSTLDAIVPNLSDESCQDIELFDASRNRLRYLLFYGRRFPSELKKHHGGLKGWITRHKYGLSLASYLLVLVSIGVANSGSGHSLKMYVSQRFLDVLEFFKKRIVVE